MFFWIDDSYFNDFYVILIEIFIWFHFLFIFISVFFADRLRENGDDVRFKQLEAGARGLKLKKFYDKACSKDG